MNNSGNETKIQYRIPRTILNENKRLWNENNQLKQRINELEEEIIKANKKDELFRVMVENEELKRRK